MTGRPAARKARRHLDAAAPELLAPGDFCSEKFDRATARIEKNLT